MSYPADKIISEPAFVKGIFKSPIGNLEIIATDKGIRKIMFTDSPISKVHKMYEQVENCKKQLQEYFAGERKQFTLDLDIQGTEFQKLVWMTLLTVPFGKTLSYLEIAKMIGDPNAVRAVGMANNKNNIPIIIPCHRIVGAKGELTGYAGGLWRKDWLIKHELTYSDAEQQLELF